MRIFIAPIFALIATHAVADVTANFREGAPKDRFAFEAQGACLTGPVEITVDLSGSAAGLVFDTTDAGAGVEVFQPFELTDGADLVTATTPVGDGDTSVTLSLSSLPQGQAVAFTIDVDDTLGGREITVNGAEISGATVVLSAAGAERVATFDDSAKTVLAVCG